MKQTFQALSAALLVGAILLSISPAQAKWHHEHHHHGHPHRGWHHHHR